MSSPYAKATGKPVAVVGQITRVLGAAAGDDPEVALRGWRGFVEDSETSGAWPYVTPRNAGDRVRRWVADRRRRGAGGGVKVSNPETVELDSAEAAALRERLQARLAGGAA